MNRVRVVAITGDEPISVDEAGENLRAALDDNSPPQYVEADRIEKLIRAAREYCEEETEISLVQKTLEVTQDSFYPSRIELPYGPVRSVVSVYYLDPDGVDTLLAADQYRLDIYGSIEALIPAYDVTLPDVRRDTNSIRVRYTAGYPSTDSPPEEIPELARQAMHLLISHLFHNREAVDDARLAEVPLGVRSLLGKIRRGLGV